MPSLTVSRYKPFSNSSDVGDVARFRLRGKPTGLILQYVCHRTCFGDRTRSTTRRFTEAWRVHAGKMAHGGEDYFLIPKSYHTTTGAVSLSAHAWFVEGDPTKLLRAMKLHDTVEQSPVSGILPSNKGRVAAKYRRTDGVKRFWCVTWSKHKSARAFKPDETVHWRE